MNKRSYKGKITILMAISLLLSACSNANNAGNEEGSGHANANSVGSSAVQEERDSNINKEGLPIVKEKVSLQFVTTMSPLQKKPYADLQVVKDFEAKTNVHIDWDAVPSESYKEKKNLIFAGGSLPDAFYGINALDDADVTLYGDQGYLIPLEDLIEAYAPNIKRLFELRPEYKEGVTSSDGHIYSIPTIHEQDQLTQEDALFINKKWLDTLGLPLPATVEQFEQVLQAFKQKDPNGNNIADEIPFSFIYGGARQDGIYSMFGSFGRLDNPDHLVIENGQLVFTADKPAYREAVEYFNRLYQEGLIDPESFTQDTQVITAKGKNEGVPILGAFVGWNAANVLGPERAADYVALAPLKDSNGNQLWNKYHGSSFTRSGFSITSASKYPEVAIRWIDAQYEEEESLQWSSGPIGVNLIKNGDRYDYAPIPEGKSYGEFRHTEAPGNQSARAILRETFAKINESETNLAKIALWNFYKPYQPKEIYPLVVFDAADLERLNILKTDLYSYIDKKQAQFIVKGFTQEDWDSYVKELEKMNLNELLDIYSRYYDKSKR
ncbi:carbohydrate ABC transporter substrate-binding protein (CUT1 family) [Paenibacillus cellulosilyticus]|uniref:Carbohydrate ABC transporter substrate-binding protein (CUT1 family) n=1 Tax=Paenibacillus cellulosilyticus TaxID=375489 RepID=A0A2V2YQL7_9BACL|nr:extracellular solute-binding protein [Paenibacillus cellulosilyticus]PWV99318.1 carbohydrate ABC transporter substrate-binding protein (CUT1 family) [Paenibacillus cellulosilyticus]QKS45083.1 extracellular solute-binding protein [Paenibacillus cellulosilyticus]